MKVNITKHAKERYYQYVEPLKVTKLAALVERHLFEALRQGVTLENAAVQLEIYRNLNAVVVPGQYGGWDVVTFYQTDEGEGEREKPKVKTLTRKQVINLDNQVEIADELDRLKAYRYMMEQNRGVGY